CIGRRRLRQRPRCGPARGGGPVTKIRVAQVITRCIAGAGAITYLGAAALDPDRFVTTILSGSGGRLLDEAEGAGFEVIRLAHMRPEINPRADLRALKELTEHLGGGGFDGVHTH